MNKPEFRNARPVPRYQIPMRYREWLLDEGSLTKRLEMYGHRTIKVRLLKQAPGLPDIRECEALELGKSRVTWIREVELLNQGEPWVYARSTIPISTWRGPAAFIKHLGTRSLGTKLFTLMRSSRSELKVLRIGSLWARHSTFWVDGAPLLVSEVFLPACPLYHLAD